MGKVFKKIFGIKTPSQPSQPPQAVQPTPAVRAVDAPTTFRETEQERVDTNRSSQRKQRATGKRALKISTVGSNTGSSGVGTNV